MREGGVEMDGAGRRRGSERNKMAMLKVVAAPQEDVQSRFIRDSDYASQCTKKRRRRAEKGRIYSAG
jgi:hypothetical protein